ncbi:GDPmannose 4,6-dehydratase [Rhodococcoides kroppenstedtii]|uniref:GDP-mannose 4,6-dehydratase n=2 Tax=Rhodococcoides kroppenstedtii TaxID=293050 RepID=A0A1I0TMS8_9NOCA|nr:GDPmannose 4,6-dehydratase [Rhodococcus kroppenstedtii]
MTGHTVAMRDRDAESGPPPSSPVALITGVAGQDGTYLAQLLLRRGWTVHGITRPDRDAPPYEEFLDGVDVRFGDVSDPDVAAAAVADVRPDHIFHLAGISSVWKSWNDPVLTTRVNSVSAAALLNAAVHLQDDADKPVVFVNASSAEIFAGSGVARQDESTPVVPTSPYGATKAMSHSLVQVYRSKGLAGINAILYNHESPRRPDTFVTRKITKAAAAIAAGRQDSLALGDVRLARDWGWAPDYVEAMAAMAVRGVADDFVVATGHARTIEDFVAAAFSAVGIADWRSVVTLDEDLLRPADAAVVVGDASKAKEVLGWTPTHSFEHVVAAMVEHDRALLAEGVT